MRAHITRSAAGAVALAFTFGASLAFGTFARPNARVPAKSPLGSACRAGLGMSGSVGSVAGALPGVLSAARNRALVQILPRLPYGAAYVDALRLRDGIEVRSPVTLAPRELQGMGDAIHYAAVDASGRFTCGGLSPGAYVVVATRLGGGAHVAIDVASFDVPAGRASATFVASRGFRALATVSP